MARKPKTPKFGKWTPSEFRTHLNELEAIHGQKNLASKLGISSATLKRYKTRDELPAAFIKGINREYGNKRAVLAQPETQAKIKKENQKREKVKETKKQNKINASRRVVDLDTWMDTTQYNLSLEHQKQILDHARKYNLKYAAFLNTDPREAQLLTQEQFDNMALGKPPKVKSLYLMGMVMVRYKTGDREAVQLLRADTMNYFSQRWDLAESIDQARHMFSADTMQDGTAKRFTDYPEEFINYFYL